MPLNNTVQSIIKDERGNHYQEVVFKTHKKVFALQKSQSIKKRMAKLPAIAYLFFGHNSISNMPEQKQEQNPMQMSAREHFSFR